MAAEEGTPMQTRPEPPIVPLRLVKFAPNDPNGAVEPYDPIDEDWQRWFPDPSRVREGNEVIPYLDAAKLFADMASAIRTATGPGHGILFSAWSVELDLELVPGDPSSTLAELFASAGARGIEVFVLLNKFSAKVPQFAGFDNTLDAERLDALPGVHAIHDDLLLRVPLVGDEVQTHHQKLLVVSGEEGLVGFVGGVDLEPNRLTIVQDLHLRLRGAAARDLYRTLVERWDDHDTGLSPPPPLVSTGLGTKGDLRAS
jgi:phosphatidylserine/phosphatidylglycerophosphate/cardiolipin synthase-like enzyme